MTAAISELSVDLTMNELSKREYLLQFDGSKQCQKVDVMGVSVYSGQKKLSTEKNMSTKKSVHQKKKKPIKSCHWPSTHFFFMSSSSSEASSSNIQNTRLRRYFTSFKKEKGDKNLSTEKDRIGGFFDFLKINVPQDEKEFNFREVGDFFKVSGGTVQRHYDRYVESKSKDTSMKGRPKKLTDEQEEEVVSEITQHAIEHKPLQRKEITSLVKKNLNVNISNCWVDYFIVRHESELSKTTATSKEKGRLEVSQEEIGKYFKTLNEKLNGVNPKMVLNMDET